MTTKTETLEKIEKLTKTLNARALRRRNACRACRDVEFDARHTCPPSSSDLQMERTLAAMMESIA